MKFTQRLNREDIDIEGLPPYTDIIECEFLVEWELDLEFREWGVKSAHVSIIDIQGEYTTVTYDDEGNDGRGFSYVLQADTPKDPRWPAVARITFHKHQAPTFGWQ